MYKNYINKIGAPWRCISKILFIMRLTAVIILVSLLQVSAKTSAQRLTYMHKGSTLVEVFNQIKNQTGYNVVWNEQVFDADAKIDANFNNESLESVLEYSLNGLQTAFTISKKTVVLMPKRRSIVEKVVAALSSINVRGRILGSSGAALAGATVRVKNSTRMVITNASGEFSLNAIEERAVLVISYLGYKTLEVTVKTDLIVHLEPEDAKLDEVTISTGYQKINKSQLTGAASTVTEKQYQQREAITGNFLESLEGKVPGLVYNGQTGDLTIRGVSTFDAVKQPLIVLDGFPTEMDLRSINPNDIISVSVLRDAAAAAIYGVRASNGVIIVETRRGKSGAPVFNLRSSLAIQNKPDFSYLNYAPANEFVQLQKDYFTLSNPGTFLYDYLDAVKDPALAILFDGPREGVTNPLLSQQQVDQRLEALGSYDNLKEYQRLFYRSRQARNVNLDVSGGNERSTYMLGFNYVGETPVARESENNQFMLNLANTFKFSDRINFDFRGTYLNGVNKSGYIPAYGDFYPYEHLADDNGHALPVTVGPKKDYITTAVTPARNDLIMNAGLYDQRYFPYRELTSNTNTVKTSSVRFQGRLNAKITNWLNADLGGNYENSTIIEDQLHTEASYSTTLLLNRMASKDPVSGRALFINIPQGDLLSKDNSKITNYTLRAQLNLSHKFGGTDHDLSGIAGVEQRKTWRKGYRTTYFGYDDQTLLSKPVNLQALNAVAYPAFYEVGSIPEPFLSTDYFSNSEDDRRFMSYYGQATYIYKSRYVATGSLRIDKSNLFGVNPIYKNKPLWSAGLNWRLGQEDFIKDKAWINQLQVRAATGFNGNIPTSNGGSYLLLSNGLNTFLNTPLSYYDVFAPENQSIRWETTKNYNIGLDYGFFDSRLSGSVDWYLKKSTDVFGLFDSDPTSGFNIYNANTASIRNRGLEFLVNALNVKSKGFEWRTQLTASFNHNEVLAVKETAYANSGLIVNGTNPVKGYPLGALFSYNYGGLNNTGQPYVLDKDGNKKVLSYFYTETNVDVKQEDLKYNGTTTPKYVLGLNNQFSLGQFDLSVLFMYYGGHVMRVEQPNPNGVINPLNPLKGAGNFWKQAGDESHTVIPGFSPASSSAVGYYDSEALGAYTYASQFVRKADYIRLRDVVLSYNFKSSFLSKAGLNQTQLRLQAQNPFRYTFSGNDIDPDAINRINGVRILENQPFYSLTFSTHF